MARKAEELYREALALSGEEREELVRLLMTEANNGFASPEIEKAWMDEIERRVKAIERGEMELIPGENVMRDLRKLVTK